ncbi:MAG: MFS transporter [Leptospirillia bacterium]
MKAPLTKGLKGLSPGGILSRLLSSLLEGLRGGLLSRTLAQAPFVGLLSAYAISQFSEGITQTALTWIAFRIRHGDVSLVGRIGVIQTVVPFLVLIPAGFLVDRLPRQVLLAALNLFKGATYTLVPILALFSPIRTTPLLTIVVVTAAFSAAVGPAFNASVPEFVPRDRLEHANGWVQIAGQGGYLLGPLSAAGLLLFFPAPWLLVGSGAGFALSAFLFVLISPPLPPARRDHSREGHRGESHAVSGLWGPVRILLRSRVLLFAVLMLVIFALFNAPMTLVFPLLASQLFHAPPSFYALLSGAYFLGSFLGGIILLGRRLPKPFPMILLGMILAGVAFLLVPRLPAEGAGFFLLLLAGLGLSWAQPLVLTQFQQIVPGESLGRFLSLAMSLFLLAAVSGIQGGTLYLHHLPVSSFLTLGGSVLLGIGLLLLPLVTLFRSRLS